MSKTIVIFGATGQQGGSLITHILNNPSLSSTYKIRAITRDTTSSKAQSLTSRNIEVISADVNSPSSLAPALSGAHIVFIVTKPSFTSTSSGEYSIVKSIADIAVQENLEYIIFSTLPNVSLISSGKYTQAFHFDEKSKAEDYIRTLPMKSAFITLPFYMENFTGLPFLAPKKVVGKEGKEVWEIQWNNSPSLSLPMIAAVRDTGAFITPILFHPDRYEGMNFHIAEKFYSLSEITRILKEKTGKNVVYKQIEAEEFKKKLPNIAEQAIWEAFTYPEEFGYFGSEGEETTRWAREQGVGELQSFEEFLDENPLVLS